MRWTLKLVGVIGLLTVVHGQALDPAPTTVQTLSGSVRGIGTDVRVFKGIPYAAAPIAGRQAETRAARSIHDGQLVSERDDFQVQRHP